MITDHLAFEELEALENKVEAKLIGALRSVTANDNPSDDAIALAAIGMFILKLQKVVARLNSIERTINDAAKGYVA